MVFCTNSNVSDVAQRYSYQFQKPTLITIYGTVGTEIRVFLSTLRVKPSLDSNMPSNTVVPIQQWNIGESHNGKHATVSKITGSFPSLVRAF